MRPQTKKHPSLSKASGMSETERHNAATERHSHHLSKVQQFCASTIRLYEQPSPVQSTPVLCINYQTVCTAIACPKYSSSVHQQSDCMYSHHLSKVQQFCASTIRLYVQPSPVQSTAVLCINYQILYSYQQA